MPFLRSHAMSLAALGALSGCATYHAEPLTATREAAKFQARSLNDPAVRQAVRAAGQTPGSWNCAALTQAALCLHPDLALARAQLRTAQGGLVTAGAHPNPTLGLTAQITANMLQGMAPWSLGFNLDIPIETAGKRGLRILQAAETTRAATLQLAATAWQVRSRIRKALLDLYAATKRAELLKDEAQTQAQTLQALEERVAAGEVARPDLTHARLLANQSQLLLRDAERLASESRANLAEAIGVPSDALAGAPLNLDEFSHPPGSLSPGRLRSHALLARPDVLAALAEYAASEAALRGEVAKQYPDIHLNPGFLWDQGQNKWFIIPTFELPVFNQHQGPIAEAEGRRAEAAAKFKAIQMKASAEVDRALAGFHGALKKLETAEALLAAQQKQTKSAEALREAGETDRLALLSARVEEDASRRNRFDALIEVQQAFGQVEDAAELPLP